MDSASDPDTDGIYIKTEPDTARHQNAEALTLVKLESTSDDVSGNTDAPAQQLSDMHAASPRAELDPAIEFMLKILEGLNAEIQLDVFLGRVKKTQKKREPRTSGLGNSSNGDKETVRDENEKEISFTLTDVVDRAGSPITKGISLEQENLLSTGEGFFDDSEDRSDTGCEWTGRKLNTTNTCRKSTVGVEKAQIYTSIDSLRQVLASSSTFSGRCKLLSAFLGYGIAAATGVQDPPEAGMAWAREVFGDVLHGFDFFLDRIYPFATLQDDEKNSHFLRLRLQFRLIMDIIESMDKADLSNSFHTLRLPFLEQLAGELAKRRNSGPRADPEIHSRPRFQHLFAGGLESYIKHKLEKFDKALLEELLSADYKGIMKRLSLAKNGTVLGATTPLSQATSTSVSGNRGTGTAQVSPSSYGSASSRGVKRSFGGGYT
ncbi:hypothetical protein P8C59_004477 [Phyllachora maydis]|uniref:Uncharacterized protein n=1 Tax=Phyllachora maydis TaxID=1825666 RepID=A0AAD9I455_9PEZI|nr:hypothetical protein P8C59_004477 [Phyllachora maydis]